MFRRVFSIALIITFMFSAISCGGASAPATSSTDADTGSAAETTEAVTTEEISYRSAGLPSEKFDGYAFRFVLSDQTKDYAWYRLDAEQNGEVLNDAIYQRNSTIEEAFDVDVTEVLYASASYQNNIKNAIMAGDDAFDALFVDFVRQHSYITSDLLLDLYTVDYLELSSPWWDQAVVRDFELNDRIYFITGDISPNVNIRTYVMCFNKDMVKELNLDDPYQIVRDGDWTFDTFKTYVTGVNADLNGDGKMSYEDRWGFFSETYNTSMLYVSAGGEFVVTNDAKNGLEYNVLEEANVNRLIASLEIMNDPNVTLLANDYVNANGGSWTAASAWYIEGNALFRSTVLEPIPRDFRSMETDFGMVPYPKYDEAQEEYHSLAGASSGRFVSVPITQKDLKRTGIILEALAAESVSTVTKAFYDVCLNGKYLRDEESSEMLDIAFAGKKFDWGYILNIAAMNTHIKNLETTRSNDPVSTFTSLESQINTLLTQYMEHY